MPKKKLCDCTISEILAYAIDHTDDCDPSVITGYVDCLGNPCLNRKTTKSCSSSRRKESRYEKVQRLP
jgi:hypothetical protein